MLEEQRRPASLLSRRSLVKGGLSAAAVAAATIMTARESGAAVTSMDSRMFTISSTPEGEGEVATPASRPGYGENTAVSGVGNDRSYRRQGN